MLSLGGGNECGDRGGFADPVLEPGSHIDDEYARVGLYEPKIVITTSRDPSSRLLQFAKVSPLLSSWVLVLTPRGRNFVSSFRIRTV